MRLCGIHCAQLTSFPTLLCSSLQGLSTYLCPLIFGIPYPVLCLMEHPTPPLDLTLSSVWRNTLYRSLFGGTHYAVLWLVKFLTLSSDWWNTPWSHSSFGGYPNPSFDLLNALPFPWLVEHPRDPILCLVEHNPPSLDWLNISPFPLIGGTPLIPFFV